MSLPGFSEIEKLLQECKDTALRDVEAELKHVVDVILESARRFAASCRELGGEPVFGIGIGADTSVEVPRNAVVLSCSLGSEKELTFHITRDAVSTCVKAVPKDRLNELELLRVHRAVRVEVEPGQPIYMVGRFGALDTFDKDLDLIFTIKAKTIIITLMLMPTKGKIRIDLVRVSIV